MIGDIERLEEELEPEEEDSDYDQANENQPVSGHLLDESDTYNSAEVSTESSLEINQSLKDKLAEYGTNEQLDTEDKSTLEVLKEVYLGNEVSGIDRTYDRVAQAVEELELGEFENEQLEYLANLPIDASKGFAQGAAGSVLAPASIWDGAQELKQDVDYQHSLNFYDQIERHNNGKSIPRKVGEAAGITTGAAGIYTNPWILGAGAANSVRQLIERTAHKALRERLVDNETAS